MILGFIYATDWANVDWNAVAQNDELLQYLIAQNGSVPTCLIEYRKKLALGSDFTEEFF